MGDFNHPPARDNDPSRKFRWSEGDISITPADPERDWVTTYCEGDAVILVRDAAEFGLHVQQNRRDQPADAYIAEFLLTPQGRIMPADLRRELVARGLLR